MAAIADIASSTRETVGRYFSLVSALPAALLVAYTFVLIASGAWHHSPNFEHALKAMADLSLGEVAVLVVAALGVALVLHPLQFVMVQVLEGYWGSGPVSARLRAAWMAWYRHRQVTLSKRSSRADSELGTEADQLNLADQRPFRYYRLLSERDEADRLQAEVPSLGQMMPTRLGNVLRYYERKAGAPYGLDAVQVMPYLSRIASSEDMAYVNDQRSSLDLAVRLCLTSLLAAALWVLFFWWHGLWLLVTIVPLAIAYLSYRGAVVVAGEYGRAMAVVIALNRFSLYEKLHLELPPDMASECRANSDLNGILGYDHIGTVAYLHPQKSPPEPT